MSNTTSKKTDRSFKVPARLATDWMSLTEACKELGVSRFTIADKVQKGLLTQKKFGKFVLISRASVESYFRSFS